MKSAKLWVSPIFEIIEPEIKQSIILGTVYIVRNSEYSIGLIPNKDCSSGYNAFGDVIRY